MSSSHHIDGQGLDGSAYNALQGLIAEHIANTGHTITDIATRGGLPRQTVSVLLNQTNPGGMPRRATLERLAVGLGLSSNAVLTAAAQSAGGDVNPRDHRMAVLDDLASHLGPGHLDVLLATARALQRVRADTP